MNSSVPWLDSATGEDLPAKARRLCGLARAGLPVPRGLVVAPTAEALDDPAVSAGVAELLAEGPVVVRSALYGEDEAEGSAAGLGRSQLDCHTDAEVRSALAALATSRADPWLTAYRQGSTRAPLDRAVIQHQIPRRALLVIAVPPQGRPEVELHTAAGEALAAGLDPDFAGPLATLDDPARAEVEALVQRAMDALGPAPHGHDLEIVVGKDERVHIVQARPLTTALHPGWRGFLQALKDEGLTDQLRGGTLTLDAEHNPAPLSPAHAWLMGWLREQRPAAGDPTVLAGWLYVRTLPRDLARSSKPKSASTRPTPTACDVIQQLHEHTLPQARARLEALETQLRQADAAALVQALDEAQAAFLAMIDTYIGVLVPARTRARRAHPEGPAAGSRPLSTLGRDDFLDVLPATWDLASPSLAELGTTRSEQPFELPRDEATAAVLLGEWDDHLFALGLAPLRAWFLAAGAHLGLGESVFMLSATEVIDAIVPPPLNTAAIIEARRVRLRQQARLRPPLRIEDGHPVSYGRRSRLRGIPLGESFTGRLAPRRDLAALLDDPPGPDAIVTLPALTAPAAVALQQLGVRAVCCEHGGPLSHAALMARELGLSALIGCRGCTDLPADRFARVDTQAGRLILDPSRPG
ncbi:MAG: PEP-utilizing enzyme [Myxococcota bacterium]